ncbi:thioredoxin family protein [Rhodobacteraceae bacterium R_SAG10]|jgi:peroxiredoxin|nr:thioredoxin family protein [Rhodobacteraceae bacterium R_SAG10]
MATTPPVCDFGWKAPDFALPATDGKIWSLADVRGDAGALIMFICNHCPYVLAVLDRIRRDAADLQAIGIGVAAICANDANAYPADSFTKMGEMAEQQGFTFPYLHDEDQSVARAYNAACTPDFFGFDATGGLQYRGRLDASGRNAGDRGARRELYEAMRQVVDTGQGPQDQIASMGCSIKWMAA